MTAVHESLPTFGLRPPRERLDERVRGWWRLHCLLWPGMPAVVLLVLGLLIAPARTPLLVPAAVLAVVAVAAAVALPGYWYRQHRWEITDDAVYTRSGLFWREWRAAPLSRLQTVDTSRGPLQQLTGIAALVVTTASAKGPLVVHGLDPERAEQLSDDLARRAQLVGGDGT